jgi:hypothetical protein
MKQLRINVVISCNLFVKSVFRTTYWVGSQAVYNMQMSDESNTSLMNLLYSIYTHYKR